MKAEILFCLLAGFVLVYFLLPAFPWVPFAAATWLVMTLVAGLRALFARE